MDAKTRDVLWAVSLMLIGVCTLALVIPSIIGFDIPIILTRIAGVLELISLAVLAFTTVRKIIDKRKAGK